MILFYKALYAKGRLKENAMLSPTCMLLNFVIVYILFKCGFSPIALSWSTVVCYAVIGLVIKPLLLIKIVDYKLDDIISVLLPCLKVSFFSLPIPIIVNHYMKAIGCCVTVSFFTIILVSALSVSCMVWFIGLTPELRLKLIETIKKRVTR